MNIDEMREDLKAAGVKQAANMKEETVIKKHKALAGGLDQDNKEDIAPPLEVRLNQQDKRFLDSIEFNFDWVSSIANQYGFDCFEYIHKFRAFRCYQEGKHVDWVDVNDLSLLNGGRPLCEILLKHQPLSANRQIIKYNWR